MFIYSVKLTLVVLASILAYVVIASLIRPVLREQINEKFNLAASRSRQFLVEIDHRRASPQGCERRADDAGAMGRAVGGLRAHLLRRWHFGSARAEPHPVCEGKVTTALIRFVCAQSVIEWTMTVGELIAFKMIASQVVQPILRLLAIVAGFPAGAGVGRASGRYPQCAARAGPAEPSDLTAAARRPSRFKT